MKRLSQNEDFTAVNEGTYDSESKSAKMAQQSKADTFFDGHTRPIHE